MSFLPRRRIVAPIDFSDFSMEAVDVAVDIAGSAQNVHVVHVLPDLEPSEAGIMWSAADDELRQSKARVALTERFEGPNYSGATIIVRVGDPGHQITDYAAECGADLIVIPSHGRTGVKRWLIGSVAERVVRLSHCPVLVLRK